MRWIGTPQVDVQELQGKQMDSYLDQATGRLGSTALAPFWPPAMKIRAR